MSIAAGDWDRIIAVNLRGMFLAAQAVGRHMVERGGGGVIIHGTALVVDGGQLAVM